METPFEKRMKFLEDEDSEEHRELQKRLKKTFYCGKIKKNIDCQSLAMTELAVEYLQELVPRELGRIDMFWASSLSRDVTVTPCALMLALIYLKRLKASNSQYLNQVSSSDLFLISVLVASKYLYDEGESHDVSNIQWACQTKTDIEDINESERTFLSAMDWKIFVKPEEFWSFLQDMEEKVAWKMSMKRNSFTYTDLFVIISSGSTQQILYDALLELCEMAVVFMTAYIGCVLTLCASNVIPAVIFSHALVPISSSQPDISAFVHDLPFPARLFRPLHCVPAVKRIPRRSLHNLINARFNFNAVSSPDIPQVCHPWSLSWNPAVCIQASACVTACVTVALIEELAVHSYGALLNFKSLMSSFGQSFKVNLIGGQSYDANSLGLLRGGCGGCSVDYPPNISVSSGSTLRNSSVCALRPSGDAHQKSVEANVAKRSQQNCAERSRHHLYWKAPPSVHHVSMERNHTRSYSSMSSMSRLVQVSG